MKRLKRIIAVSIATAALMTPAVFASPAQDVATPSAQSAPVGKAKYVFLFIGDGMAMSQVSAAEVYSNALASKTPDLKKLGFYHLRCQLHHHRLRLRRYGHGHR